jgi:hypothetical protein
MEGKKPLRFRKLRIVCSVACVLMTVPICGLWARSYRHWERVVLGIGGTHAIEVQHVRGQVKIITFSEQHITPGFQPTTSIYWPPAKLTIEEWSKQDRRRSDNGLPIDFPASPTGFGGEITSTRCVVFLPYWFLVSSAVFAAIALWLPWRFNIRTLLIATTIVASIFGILAISN